MWFQTSLLDLTSRGKWPVPVQMDQLCSVNKTFKISLLRFSASASMCLCPCFTLSSYLSFSISRARCLSLSPPPWLSRSHQMPGTWLKHGLLGTFASVAPPQRGRIYIYDIYTTWPHSYTCVYLYKYIYIQCVSRAKWDLISRKRRSDVATSTCMRYTFIYIHTHLYTYTYIVQCSSWHPCACRRSSTSVFAVGLRHLNVYRRV